MLPRGLQKVRYYDWMSSNCRVDIDEVRWLAWLLLGWTFWLASGHVRQEHPAKREPVRCASCGGVMRIVDVVHSNCRALVEHCLDYLDSG